MLIVDDWVERGSQIGTGVALVEHCGGTVVGISVIVDQLADHDALPPVHALVHVDALGPSDV